MVKNSPASAEDTSLIPAMGRFHMLGGNYAHVPQIPEPTHHNSEPACALEPVLCSKRSHCNEKPMYHNEEEPLLTATRESLQAATKTQYSQKQIQFKNKMSFIKWSRNQSRDRKSGETGKIRKDCRESKCANTLITATSQQ